MKYKILQWSPRILVILAILFMMMFSIDVFEEKAPLGRQLLGFLIHNIPAFILAGLLFVAWKWEMAGGLSLILITIILSILFRSFTGNPYSLIVISPFFIAGGLFILHSVLESRRRVEE
jgi:hypothetical protein